MTAALAAAGPPSRGRVAVGPAAGAARGLAAVTQAQAAILVGRPPHGRYLLSSQPQRRRPDRSARLFAAARGPGLCSPRLDP